MEGCKNRWADGRLTFIVEIDAVAAVAQSDLTLVKASGDF